MPSGHDALIVIINGVPIYGPPCGTVVVTLHDFVVVAKR